MYAYGMARPLTVQARINRAVTLKRARSLARTPLVRAQLIRRAAQEQQPAVHRSRVRAREKDGEEFNPKEVLLKITKPIYDSVNVHQD